MLLVVVFLGLDTLVNRQRFHYRPNESAILNTLFTFFDFRYLPNLPIENMVKGVHDTGSTGLFDILKANGIARPVPSPCLFHSLLHKKIQNPSSKYQISNKKCKV